MTEPIRIPNVAVFDGGDGAKYRQITGYAEVTPDIARQIVALAYRESSANDKLREIENKADGALHWLKLMKADAEGVEKRIAAALEAKMAPCGAGPDPGKPTAQGDEAADSADLLTMLAEVTLERDKALADLAALRERHDKLAQYGDTADSEIARLKADLAAAVESERRFRAEVEAAFRKHGLAAGPTAVDRLVEDLAAEREHRIWQIGQCAKVEGQVVAQRDAARAQVAELSALLRECVPLLDYYDDRVPQTRITSRIEAALAAAGEG